MRGAGRLLAASAILTAALCGAAAAAPADRTAWLERVERGRQDYRGFIEKASLARPTPPRMGEPDAAKADPTLRDGDIVVEGDRLVVFRNRRIGTPLAGELLPLDPGGAQIHANELSEIARALHRR